jgi:adhesin/invasin
MKRTVMVAGAIAAGSLGVLSCADTLEIGPGVVVAVRIAPDSAKVRIGDSVQLKAVALDSSSAFLPQQHAVWTTSASSIASVDESGTVDGLAVGSAIITANVAGLRAEATVQVDRAPSIAFSIDSVSFSAQAGEGDPPPDTVMVTNGGGFSLIGLAVGDITYADSSVADWLSVSLDSMEAPATLQLLVLTNGITAPGTYAANLSVESVDADNSPRQLTVLLVMGAGPAASLAVNDGDNQNGMAGTAVATDPSATVTDQFANPVAGATVTFAVSSGGGSLTDSVQVTDVQGIARVGSWVLGTSTGVNALVASAPGLTSVTFTATAGAAAPSQFVKTAGDAQTAVAGTPVAISPAIRLEDQFGNAVPGLDVTFTATAGGGVVNGGSQTTDANGLASVGDWTLGTSAGPNTLEVTAAGSPASATFNATGIAGSAASIAVAAGDGQTATVASTVTTPPTVLVSDANANPVSGVQVTFAVASGAGTLTDSVKTTDATGMATLGSWTLGTGAGQQQVVATAAGLGIAGNPVTFSATATPGTASLFAVSAGDGQSATAGTLVSVPPAAVATDQFGNGVAGVQVTFTVTGGGGTISDSVKTTNANGIATLGSWTLGVSVGPNTVQASAPGLTGSPLAFTANGISGSATNMALEGGSGQADTVGATLPSPYGVKVTDTNGNGVSGIIVAWNVLTGQGSITSSSATDVNGIASATHILGDSLGNQTAQAAVGGLTGSPVVFTATANVGNPASIAMVAGNGQSATVNTAIAVDPSVAVRDRLANPLENVAVTFLATVGGGTVSGGSTTTDPAGIATVGSWTIGTGAGTNNNQLTATAAGGGIANNPLTFVASATPDAASLANSLLDATEPITASAGSSTSTVTVTARDQFDNVRAGDSVTIAVTGSNNTVIQPNARTNSSGQVTGSWSSTSAADKTVSATIVGVGTMAQTDIVTVDAAAASQANSLVDASEPITASNGSSASTVTVTVRDQFGNPRSGHTVTLTVMPTTGNTVNQPGSNTDGSGQTNGTWSSIKAETKIVSASITGVGTIVPTDDVIVNPAAASPIAINAGSPQTAVVGTAVATDPSVLVTDVFSNPVPSFAVTFAPTAGGGSVTNGGQSTNANGIATVGSWTLQDGSAMSLTGTFGNTLTASSSVGSVAFSGSAIYSYATHVQAIWNGSCTGCHGGIGGLFLNPPATTSHANIVDQASTCEPATDWIDGAGGTAAETASIIMRLMDAGTCGTAGVMPTGGALPPATRDIVRAWIRNGAPGN